MNKVLKKISYPTLLGVAFLGLSPVKIYANEIIPTIETPLAETLTIISDQTIVDIPDANLSESIRRQLKKQVGDLTVGDMQRLNNLHLSGEIRNLNGLEHATNLTSLVLEGTFVTDLSPISGVTTLTNLQILTTPVKDLSPIENLTNISTFALIDTAVMDLAPLNKLTHIDELTIFDNSINGLEQLKNTNIRKLSIGGSSLTDLSPIKELNNVRSLLLSDECLMLKVTLFNGGNFVKTTKTNQISPVDLTPLKEMKSLKELVLAGKSFTNLNGIEGLTNLKELVLIEDISIMGEVTDGSLNLLELLNPMPPIDLTPLKGLKNLQQLLLSGSFYNDLNGLEALTNLKGFILIGAPVEDLSPLANLSNLEVLMLGLTSVYDFSPLRHLALPMLNLLPMQASIKEVSLDKNTLKNPYQFSDGTYLKFKKLQDGVTQSEDGSMLYFENPQKGEPYFLETDICFEIEGTVFEPQTTRYSEQRWIQSVLSKFSPSTKSFDCPNVEVGNVNERNTQILKTKFDAYLTIDGLMGEVNAILNVGEQINDQKIITIDFTDSFYPIERIILPDGTEIQGSQATFIVEQTSNYVFKAFDSQGNEYTQTQYVEIKSPTAIEEDTPNDTNKPSTPEDGNPSDVEKPSIPDQPSVEPDTEESDKGDVIPSNPTEGNQESSKPNNNQASSNQSQTNKPERPIVETGLNSIGMIGLGLISLILGAIYLNHKRK